MSTGSQAAVTSPLMSTTAVFSPTRRTSIVIADALIGSVLPLLLLLVLVLAAECGCWLLAAGSGGRVGELADGAVEIGKELDEVRQPGDVEDLAVMRGQAAGDNLPAFGPGPGEHADDQCDAGRVDVVHRGKVEHHGVVVFRAGRDGPLVGIGQHRGGGPVDLSRQLDDGGSGKRPGRGLTCARHLPHLQFAWSARWCAAGRPWLCPSRRPCCGSGTGPSRAGSGRRRASG